MPRSSPVPYWIWADWRDRIEESNTMVPAQAPRLEPLRGSRPEMERVTVAEDPTVTVCAGGVRDKDAALAVNKEVPRARQSQEHGNWSLEFMTRNSVRIRK